MQADLSHFIIEDKQNLGWRFHWLRAEQQEPIGITIMPKPALICSTAAIIKANPGMTIL